MLLTFPKVSSCSLQSSGQLCRSVKLQVYLRFILVICNLYFVFGAFTADLLILQLLIKYGFDVPSGCSLRYGKRDFVRFLDVHWHGKEGFILLYLYRYIQVLMYSRCRFYMLLFQTEISVLFVKVC